MPINFKKRTILNSDNWVTGSGGITGFNQNGNTSENERVNGTDPFGNTSVLWECRSDGDNSASGGWNSDYVSSDNTKLYRFSVWVRKTVAVDSGTFYFGLNGGTAEVRKITDGTQADNPYWDCRAISSLALNQWYLFVGHCFPYTYSSTSSHPNTGVYTRDGGRVDNVNFCNVSADVKFASTTSSLSHRTYHYYSTNTSTRLQFFNPKIEVCDGSEGTIDVLLGNLTTSVLSSTSITKEGASRKTQKVVSSGGNISYVGQWKIHTFTASGSFVLTSYIQNNELEVDYLIVGGGGGGGMDMGGGGGGGGVLFGSTLLGAGTYSIVVGGGGAGAPAGCSGSQPCAHQFTISASSGQDSSFNGLTAYGGGYGASSYYGYTPNYGTPGNGGCGGGPSGYTDGSGRSGGTGVSGQGYAGGSTPGTQYYSAGGGGAGAVGASATNKANGGVGIQCSILGRNYYWSGGGGGAGYSIGGGDGGYGGGGGGAAGIPSGIGGVNSINWGKMGYGSCTGCWGQSPGGNGGQYSGGGGGGGSHYNATNAGGNGGSGIVVIRYKYR